MKLFISMPMRNKKPEEIEALMKKYHGFCEKVILGNSVELIKSHDPERKFKSPVEALAESLKLMSEADIVFFAPGWEKARGCRIENAVSEAYGIDYTDGNHWAEYLANDLQSITLRECPHCGADGGFLARMSEVNADTDSEVHYVICCNCGARSGRTGDKVSADAEWNRRAKDDSSDAASLPAVDVRMEEPNRNCDTQNETAQKSHVELLQEVTEELAKEILSRLKENAADKSVQDLIWAHRQMMESIGMIPTK